MTSNFFHQAIDAGRELLLGHNRIVAVGLLAAAWSSGGGLVFWQRPGLLAAAWSFGGGLVFWRRPGLLAAAWSSGGGLVFWRQAGLLAAATSSSDFIAENDRSRKLSCPPSSAWSSTPLFRCPLEHTGCHLHFLMSILPGRTSQSNHRRHRRHRSGLTRNRCHTLACHA